MMQPVKSWPYGFLGLGILFVFLVVPQLPISDYWIRLLNDTGIYTLPVLGLVLLTGFARITSLGQAAFVGIGAYATALSSVFFGLSPWMGLLGCIVLAVCAAFVIGLVTMRLSGHFLTLATLAWGLALFYLFSNMNLLGKYDGLSGLPALQVGEYLFDSPRKIYYLILLVVVFALIGVRNLLNSRIGRAIQTLQGGNVLAEAMGINSQWLKMLVFVLAAVLAAISGFLYAGLQRAVSPSTFGINYGVEYLFMAVIGGMGAVWGAVLGAMVITILKDVLKSVLPQILGSQSNYEMVVLGVVMIFILQYTRSGLWGGISRFLPQRVSTRAPTKMDKSLRPLPSRRCEMPPGALLEVKALRKTFGELVAVNDLDFSVGQSQIVSLIGPNGAGKSTVFNLVSGVLPLTSGEILFCGERISGLSSRKIIKKGIGRTFQHVKLMPQMTVLENVAVGAHLRGRCNAARAVLRLDRAEEKSLLAEAAKQIERVGLAAHMYTPAGSLALGQQRIVEIARALAADPTLLLLDEPAAGLRYQEKQALAELLKKLRSGGMSVLLVEHDMDFVMNLTDYVVVMEFGSCIATGAPQDIQQNEAVRAAYLGGSV